jgi:hypothetical protein
MTTLFESEKGLAVMLASFAFEQSKTVQLSVDASRKVTSVQSALRGKLEWSEKDGRIEVTVPQLPPAGVDVIILR